MGGRIEKKYVALAREAEPPVLLFLGAVLLGVEPSRMTEHSRWAYTLRDRALRRLIGDFGEERDAAVRFREFCSSRGSLLPGELDMSMDFERGLTFEPLRHVDLIPNPLGVTLAGFAEEVGQAKSGSRRRSGQALAEILGDGSRVVLVTV